MRSLLNLKHTLNDEYVDVPSRSLDSSGYAIDPATSMVLADRSQPESSIVHPTWAS